MRHAMLPSGAFGSSAKIAEQALEDIRGDAPLSQTDILSGRMQMIGRPFDEATSFRVGNAYRDAQDWHTSEPLL
jgi:hypothetical protein